MQQPMQANLVLISTLLYNPLVMIAFPIHPMHDVGSGVEVRESGLCGMKREMLKWLRNGMGRVIRAFF